MDWAETARITYKAHCQRLVRERGVRDINPWLSIEDVGSEPRELREHDHAKLEILARSFGVPSNEDLVHGNHS